ncbi:MULTISPECIES: carbohydrate ABC transporter permease [unclassified Butyrivibrio]|uniref:carbohydrate ABC transporter permease n=1 Tax=unclassified Butyrivibrio TaxID=2639466 RepID=UPI00041378EA|nr:MULTISPECIES: carbohydrate ABC transporter permease [unclassified Butyrivibrio]
MNTKKIAGKTGIICIYGIVVFLGLCCLLPLWYIVAISFSKASAVEGNMVSLIPIGFNTVAYEEILTDAQYWRSFLISILRVILAVIINLSLTVSMAYALTKNNKQFHGRDIYMNILIFAMLFNGGMIPTFLAIKKYHLLNTIWALVLPGAVPIFNVILLMNFFLGIPKSLEEAAVLDGANPLQVLTRVYIPCSVPVLATVTLFSIVGSWNDFYSGLIYITRIENYPLMTYIQSLTINMEEIVKHGTMEDIIRASQVSEQNLNAAKIVVAVIPLMLIYPFLQKYFITGIVIGSVKE